MIYTNGAYRDLVEILLEYFSKEEEKLFDLRPYMSASDRDKYVAVGRNMGL